MEILSSLEALMEEKIGLCTGSIGDDFFQKVIKRRMTVCQISTAKDYLDVLRTSDLELNELIEELTIPETWFFRNRKQLEYLADYVKNDWLPNKRKRKLRILSIPCATGEEPYTIAMILLDIGLLPGQFHIDAADISSYVLKKAEAAVFDEMSFRGENLEYRDRYFEKTAEGYSLLPEVREQVRFLRGNIIDETFLTGSPAYDIIFSRNLFIYLSTTAKDKAARFIDRLLVSNGILFMGHTEKYPFEDINMERIRQPGVFAYARVDEFQMPVKTESKKRPPVASMPVEEKKIVTKTCIPREKKPAVATAASIPKHISAPTASTNHDVAEPADSIDPDTPVDLFEKAQQLADQGELEKALAFCEKIIELNSMHTEAYFLKGVIYGAKDDNLNAEECFNRLLYLNPEHIDAMRHLMVLAQQAGDCDKADRIKERIKRIRKKKGTD